METLVVGEVFGSLLSGDSGIYAYASSSAAPRSGADPAPWSACGAGGGDGIAGGVAGLGGACRVPVRVAGVDWAGVPVLRDDAGFWGDAAWREADAESVLVGGGGGGVWCVSRDAGCGVADEKAGCVSQ